LMMTTPLGALSSSSVPLFNSLGVTGFPPVVLGG
jgi:hypothetical protein